MCQCSNLFCCNIRDKNIGKTITPDLGRNFYWWHQLWKQHSILVFKGTYDFSTLKLLIIADLVTIKIFLNIND
jgi:hypothetical protein